VDALLAPALLSIRKFESQNLANLAWGLATLKHSPSDPEVLQVT
jgi:hypothetical protein